ncbi:unnamed protein product [Alopecurus aequalis]
MLLSPSKMPPAPVLLPEGATALEIPSVSDRPASIELFMRPEIPAAATAVRRLADASLPDSLDIYHNGSGDDLEMHYSPRLALSCITPETAPCRAEPGAFIRRVFRTLALDLPQTFLLLPAAVGYGDTPVLFRTAADRDAAMCRQPFVLDGVTVRLVPVQMILNVGRAENGYMVHVALHDYPVHLRTQRDIGDNVCRVGFLCEIDAASCFTLSTAVVLQVEHPRQIPHELRINYTNGTTSVVPVEIVSVWDCRHSYDAHGEYVPIFKSPQDGYGDRLFLDMWLRAMALAQGFYLNMMP